MIYYQSGVSSGGDAAILQRCGVQHVLVDQFDVATCYGRFDHVALDSGAFRAMRRKVDLFLDEYCEAVVDIQKDFDFVVSLDVIGNPAQSMENWLWLRLNGLDCIPVWHFDTDQSWLHKYLDLTDGIIGIGGLAGIFRDTENPARGGILRQLHTLCDKHPDRFHIFGLNWVKAINELKDTAHSADSSLWLRGARYGTSVFRNSRHGTLSQAPSWVLEQWAEKNGKEAHPRDRTGLLRGNARSIDRYCNKTEEDTTA